MPADDTAPKSLTDLEAVIDRRFRELTGSPLERCTIEFYPYSKFTSTIRLHDRVLRVRLSDLLTEATAPTIESFALKLLHKLTRTRVPRSVLRRCDDFLNQPDTIRRERELRRTRGRKRCLPPGGEVFDLEALYRDLNRIFFESDLQVKRLGWSTIRSTRRLGHYDPAHDTIVLSRRLDNPLVPEYVVRFVLYHEMLHARIGDSARGSTGRRRIHTAAFRRAEREYPDYRRALDFIHKHLRRV